MSVAVRLLAVGSLAASVAVGLSSPAAAAGLPAPVVTQVVPVQGSTVGYTKVVIDGRGFTGVSSVVVGGFKATRLQVLSAHRLTVAAPPHGHGPKNVVVHTSHGTSRLSKATTFNYVHATLSGTWTSSPVAPPADAAPDDDLRLVDTSCPSVSTCYSVGGVAYDDPGTGPVIRTRMGSSSSLVYAPTPADTDRDGLYRSTVDAIDCPAVGSCAAIGYYPVADSGEQSGFHLQTMLLTLSGGTWRTQTAPDSAGTVSDSAPPDVSCGAPRACLVSANGRLYRLAGDTWSAVAPVVPSGGENRGVQHVSCATATYCAVALAGSPNTYLDTLEDNQWTSVPVHAPAGVAQTGYRPEVLALQCTDAQKCVAVIGNDHGKYYNTDFLRLAGSGLDGQAHHLIPPPRDIYSKGKAVGYRPHDSITLGDVPDPTLDCPSTTTCFTVNHYYAATGGTGRVEHSIVARLAGSTVHVFVMPEVAGTGIARTFLTNVSCPSVSSCVAVGSREPYGDMGNYMDSKNFPSAPYDTFANGVWTPGSLPTVAGQPDPSQGQFVDLDCAAVGHCFADAAYLYDPDYSSDRQGYNRSQDLDALLSS